MADDEFVLGFWDSEWTGIAPMLEEDVAMSSVSQDEIGHARAWYELLAGLTDDDADRDRLRPRARCLPARRADEPRRAPTGPSPWRAATCTSTPTRCGSRRSRARPTRRWPSWRPRCAARRRITCCTSTSGCKRLAEAGGEARERLVGCARPPVDRCAGRLHAARRRVRAGRGRHPAGAACPRCGPMARARDGRPRRAGPAGAGPIAPPAADGRHAADR